MRPFVPLMIVLALVGASGCSRDQTGPTDRIDLVHLVSILPTPRGLDQSNDARAVDVAAVTATLTEGIDVPQDAADRYARLGLRDAARRTWTGRGGAHVTILATRWPDHMTAATAGAGAADVLPDQHGATPWTPEGIRGARGSRGQVGGRHTATLSLAVERVNLFVRATGPVDDDAIVRTMELASTPLIAATGK